MEPKDSVKLKMLLNAIFLCGLFFFFIPVSHAAYRNEVPGFDGILIDHDETWRKDDTHILDKEVRLVDGAKLIIEPGTHVVFRSEVGGVTPFEILDGSVEAIGTPDLPIFFERASSEDSFYIDLSDWTERQSIFRQVRIVGGGYLFDNSSPQAFFRSLFIHQALASEEEGIAALSFWGGRFTIEDSVFSESVYADVWTYDSRFEDWIDDKGTLWPDPSLLSVRHSDFSGDRNVPALRVEDDSCADTTLPCPRKITFENNWYGSGDGPRFGGNPAGSGKAIFGTINLTVWSATKNICTEQCYSNVMFLPGLKASRLYLKEGSNENQLWEPNRNLDVEKLYLDENGKSKNDGIYTRDILDEANLFPIGQVNIYKTFIAQMNKLKDVDHFINDWKPVAYDWRLSFDDVLADGTIENTLRNLAKNSKSGKVTLVAHSNGGLLTKALLKKLGDEETKKLVDKIIFVAVPQVGTPSAIAGMLHGEKQNIFPVLDANTARGLGENMPGAYQLLPSEKYFSTVQTSAVTFDTAGSPDWKDRYSDPIDSREELHDFLSDGYRRVEATDPDTDIPSQLNEGLLNHAEGAHDTLDNWVAPSGVRVVQIAGWGVPATLSSVKYETKKICDASSCSSSVDVLHPNFDFTLDGDGVVVFPSALSMDGAERYWVDMKKYNRLLNRLGDSRILKVEHKDILEISDLDTFIADSIVNITKPLTDYSYLSTEISPSDNEKRLQYSLQSPLTLDLSDDQGRHTGITSDGNIEEQIPGTYYRQFGDMKYIFADESSPMRISMSGYDTGTFTFSVKELRGDTTLGQVTFKDMPTTPETRVAFDMPSDLEHASDLRIDLNGDETIDYQLQPKIGEVVMLKEKDRILPVTTSSFSGTQGPNQWYTSDVIVTLIATDNDNGSGVEKTEYSLNNGITWSVYTDPFVVSNEGINTFQYQSIDKEGNKEAIKTEVIQIDKTAPEAKITFNPITQKFEIADRDNSSNVSVVILEKPEITPTNKKVKKMQEWFLKWQNKHRKNFPDTLVTLTDEAGHITSLSFEKSKDRNGFIFVSLQSIGYDGNEIILSDTSAQYKWRINKKSQYHIFASRLKAGSVNVESHYIPRKNETWIMERPNDLRDDTSDDESERRPIFKKLPGMVVPYMETERGRIHVKY